MNKTSIEPECTGQFSPFFIDYVNKKPRLSTFYNYFPNLGNFKYLIDERNFDQQKRKVLQEVLQEQYSAFPQADAIHGQIAKIGDKNTFTVTTGHQLNLCTGPLYFIYKIITTINLAKQLTETYPKFNFIPVYWMATEDHDFEEINYFKLNSKKYQWETIQKGPVGSFLLDSSFQEFLKSIPFAPDFFKEAYTSSKILSEAVRKYVHYLFGKKGLIIIDGNDAKLKRQFISVIKEDLNSGTPHKLVNEQTEKLEKLGYKSQIFPRPINFFHMENGLRERIEKIENRYQVLNTAIVFEEEELMDLIEKSPEKFSPNVVLRPLYQEQVLPNLAYIGGPAEVVYWLQLKSLFDHFQTSFPAVMPRNFAAILDNPTLKKMEKLKLDDRDLFLELDLWKKRFVKNNSEIDLEVLDEKEELSRIFEETGSKAAKVDITLAPAFEAGKVRATKILEHLARKIRKAEERRQGDQIRQMESIKNQMFPGGSPQERVENFMGFYLEDEKFIEKLMGKFDPLDFDFMLLKFEDGKS